eukprot:7376891-Prymnesium_polylepis.1
MPAPCMCGSFPLHGTPVSRAQDLSRHPWTLIRVKAIARLVGFRRTASQSESLGALRWSGCEVGLCERVDDDRLASRVGEMRGCRQAYRSCVRSEI